MLKPAFPGTGPTQSKILKSLTFILGNFSVTTEAVIHTPTEKHTLHMGNSADSQAQEILGRIQAK